MSHSVFRDLDDEKNSGSGSRGEVADNNLIVFINKDGDVQVDPNALQDLIVNVNSADLKSTVSVIRVSSPTPSMQTDEDDSSTKQSDDEKDNQNDDESNKTTSDSNEDSEQDDDDDKGQKGKKKKKNKVPGIGLTVENFFNPQQAVAFATEIMNIAGITNPKQLKADYEHLRYIIQNDHCYTPYTYADSLSEGKSDDTAESAKRDAKNKSKLPTTAPSQSTTTTKKNARNSLLSKSLPSNGMDRDTSNSGRNRSIDDATSSTENTADRSSEEEEAESETDFSDFSASDTDNDRDSDLDFSVNDCHSRRAKKIKKRKIKAKKLANKKRRRSTVDFTGSDDGSTPNRKKFTKLPKKTLNTSAKSSNAQTPTVSTTTKSPAISAAAATKSPAIAATAIKSPPATSTPRITKLTYVKENPQITSLETTPKLPMVQRVQSTTVPQPTSTTDPKPKIIIVKQKEKKVNSENVLLSDMSSLFTPDVIKKNPMENASTSKIPVSTPPAKVELISKTLTPVVIHSNIQQSTQRICTTKLIKAPLITYRKAPKPTLNLASEQDKQLDLIDSLVQEELSKTEPIATSSSSITAAQTVIPAAIPNIVKMLETSEPAAPMESTDLQQPISSTNNMPITYSTTTPVNDSQMLPDDLLESFVNSDYLSDDLMQHVAKLVEDKNLQEVIDQQVLGVGSMAPCTVPSTQLHTAPTLPKPIIVHTPQAIAKELEQPNTPPINTIKTPSVMMINVTPTSAKEPIKVKRSDGRIITLPPIEAPTTRGAKRRAEITPGSDPQPKPKVFTVIVQNESPTVQKNPINSPTVPGAKGSPLTASKAKPILARERRASVAVKRASLDAKPRRSMSISNPPPATTAAAADDNDDDDDDEEDGSDGSYNSEDDPHRLWCICRTPHNNRFMICCDKCEEWFHGKCVGITRQTGRDMEERQSEWICPNCIKKQQPSIKNIFPRKKPIDSPIIKMKGAGSLSPVTAQSTSDSTISNCIVCGSKPSRVNSVYCSDDCIRKHASTTKAVTSSVSSSSITSNSEATPMPSLKSPTEGGEKKTIQPKIVVQQLFKDKANHVVIYDKSTGKYLTGKMAPTTDKLNQWLTEHPHHEALKPGTPQAAAFRAKQQQLKTIARDMEVERELFAVTQPVKIQTKLRFEADKMVCVNPITHKQATTTIALKRSISAVSSPPASTKSPATKIESITKIPKLSSTPTQKMIPQKKRTPDIKTPSHSKSESSGSKNERDRLRINAKKTLIEQLVIRTKEIADPTAPRLTESEIAEFVEAAEEEMFDMFGGDTNTKYKSKYRSLMYNIRDRKNLTLFQKISSKMIEPKQLVRLTTDELASQELAKWRENENKHQLEMITKSELDMLACGNSYVLKTHKGEEVIQESSERITLDPSIPVQDLVSVLNSSTVSSSDASIVTRDNRVDKLLSPDVKPSYSSSGKRDSERAHEKKDRHESRSGGSSSKHKRKRSRERHSSHSHSHSHKDRDRGHDKEKKERSSATDSRKDKKDHKSSSSNSSSSSNRSKHQQHIEKDRKRESTSKSLSAPKMQKTDDIIDRILKAQSTIDSILHPEEFKKTGDNTSVANVSSASLNESVTLVRQPSVTNESDQEPTSTVTIPSPPEVTPEFSSTTPPPLEKPSASIIWTGNINMVDVATFQVSLSVLSGSSTMIDFPKEFDVVGRINPDTVWEYLEKIRISKDIVLLRFSPRSSAEDDETAYSTFISYLDSRQRLGVIKIPSKFVKDFYILPLTSHKSLPSILKSTTGFDLGADRPDLLLGIIVRNRVSPSSSVPAAPKHRPSVSFIGHKAAANTSAKEEHYTPPSSPNISISQTQINVKQTIKSFSTNLDDDEPYSPGGGSDEDDLMLNTIPTTYLTTAATNPIPDYAKQLAGSSIMSKFDQEKLDELNRQIEAEKKQIAMHLRTVDIDEPYSPTSSVSPPINTNLSDVVSNISIPANLADILKNVASFGSSGSQMPMNQYSTMMDTSDTEYVPVASASSSMSYAPAPTQLMQPISVASQPSKLAQLTDEELLRLVPDEI